MTTLSPDRPEAPGPPPTTAVPENPGILGTLRNAFTITQREVWDSFHDWRIIIPIFLLTLVFPVLANIASFFFISLFEDYGETEIEGLTEAFLPLMPMLVGFFPMTISLVIALETFVGEKERLSLEPLLSTPLTNTELYIGKVLAAIIPPLLAGYMGIALYLIGQIFGPQQWRPDLMLVVQIVLLTAIQAMVMVTGAVVISSQTTSTRAANLLASLVILPMAMLVIWESVLMLRPDLRYMLWYVMVGLLVAIALLMRVGTRIFRREELLGRSIDHLNFRWAWEVFSDQWRGGVQGFAPLAWYQQSVFPTLRAMQRTALLYLLFCLLMFGVGLLLSNKYQLPLEGYSASDATLLDTLRDVTELGRRDPSSALSPFSQNLRVLVGISFMSIFTFGVMALLLAFAPFAALGYALGNLLQAGLSPLPLLLTTLPHGLLEMAALIVAGTAALRLGASITNPPSRMTASELFLRALADALKLGVAIVVPLLLLAALIEVYVTPALVQWVSTP